MEQVLAMGMEQGLTEAVGQIDAILPRTRRVRVTEAAATDEFDGSPPSDDNQPSPRTR
jgi:hypothetical protein